MTIERTKAMLEDFVSLAFCFLLAILAWLYWHFLDQKGVIILMLLPVPLVIGRVGCRFYRRRD